MSRPNLETITLVLCRLETSSLPGAYRVKPNGTRVSFVAEYSENAVFWRAKSLLTEYGFRQNEGVCQVWRAGEYSHDIAGEP